MLENWVVWECKLGGQRAASGTAGIGSEHLGSDSGSAKVGSGAKVVCSFSDMPAKKMWVAGVENLVRGISISCSGVVKFESVCSDISTQVKHVSKDTR